MREKTHAHRKMEDNVPEHVKKERLQTMIDLFYKKQLAKSQEEIGRYHLVLVNEEGKKANQMKGKTDTFKSVVFDNREVGIYGGLDNKIRKAQKGDYMLVKVNDCTSSTLFGEVVSFIDFADFFKLSSNQPFFLEEKNLIN